MEYQALYRTWRPLRFDEVVGQNRIITALKNAVNNHKLTHAYLFSGPRGTGKTSVAKIVARAVNCNNLDDGEPCNQCATCRDIINGNFMDVIELDAASNRGIDEIRDLREKVRILPAQGKKKVYIIDEVHMLTTEAFNALLKTIEDPPDSVIFILATTEIQKIPATIISRCQVYKFRRITLEEIKQRLHQVVTFNEVNFEEDALMLLARRANGGMRDALSMLDQILSYQGKNISRADVFEVLGLVDDYFLYDLIEAIIKQDVAMIVKMISKAVSDGKELQQLARELAYYLRDMLISLVEIDKAEYLVVGEENQNKLKKQIEYLDYEKILMALDIMMNAAEKLKLSEGNRFLLEMALFEIMNICKTSSRVQPNYDEYIDNNNNLIEPADKLSKNEAREILWKKILTGVKKEKIPTHALLAQGTLLGSRDNAIYIGFKKGYKFHKEKLEEKANREIVEKVIQEILEREIQIQFIFMDDEQYNDIVVKKAIEFFGKDIIEIKD